MAGLAPFLRLLTTNPAVARVRAHRAVAYLTDLFRRCFRELSHDEAFEMAAALTYRTIFSLVPLLVLSLVLFNTFGGLKDQLPKVRERAYELMGLKALSAEEYLNGGWGAEDPRPQVAWDAADPGSEDPAGGQAQTRPATAPALSQADRQRKENQRETIDDILTGLTDQVAQVNFSGIASVGLVLLIWTAIGLLVTIETAFNKVYNCAQGRSWFRRVVTYWAVITLGAALLFITLYLAGKLTDWVADLGFIKAVVWVFSRLMALLAMWLLLFLLYTRMPNTQVHARPAAIGALVGAVLWESGKWSFGLYVSKAVPYYKLYGALGLVPLFLFWLYIGWVIILLGLELSFVLQMTKSGRFKHAIEAAEKELFYDPRSVIPMMAMIGAAFRRGDIVDEADAARELEIPIRGVAIMAQKLRDAGLIHRVELEGGEGGGYALARAPETITLAELLDLARTMTSGGIDRIRGPVSAWMARLTKAQQDAAGDTTLAKLIDAEAEAEARREAREHGGAEPAGGAVAGGVAG